jgi:REP element-mobilizing transposase RayT
MSFLKFPPRNLTSEQCLHAQDLIPEICARGHWQHHACACAPDHVHVILTSPFDPKRIRALLKRWLGQSFSERWLLDPDQTWWAEDGSTKWIHDEQYFNRAVQYVTRQRMQLQSTP